MRLTRWHVLAASFLAIFTGQPGPWGVYSDTIKTRFDLTQSQLDTVASANAYINIMLLSIVPGLIYDRISQTCGDRVAAVVILGTTGSFIAFGTVCFWATVVGRCPVFFPVTLGGATGQLTFFNAVLAWGGEFCTAAVIPIVIKNFPAHRGIAVASAKSLNGVGSALVAQFYNGFLSPDTTAVILVGAWTSTFAIIAMPFMRISDDAAHPADLVNTNARFVRILALELMMCGVALGASLTNNFDDSDPVSQQAAYAQRGALVVLGSLLLVFASPVICCCGFSATPRRTVAEMHDNMLLANDRIGKSMPISNDIDSSLLDYRREEGIIDYRRKDSSPAPRPVGAAAAEDVPLKDAIRTLNFWLYIFCLFVSFGGGNYVNANIAQIVQASGGKPEAIPFLITIMSLASCLSRVLVGATAQLFEDAGLPRTLFVLGSVSCMLGSQLLLATATKTGLYLGATLGMFGYGACYAFHPTIVSDLYGVAHLATLYKVASWTDAWGMFVMGKLVFQHVYMGAIDSGHNVKPPDFDTNDRLGVNDTDVFDLNEYGSGSGGYLPYDPFPGASSRSKACYGAACFRPTAVVGCGLSAAAVASAIMLVCRTSSQYRNLWSPHRTDSSKRPHRQNYTRELAAQREEDYRRLQVSKGIALKQSY